MIYEDDKILTMEEYEELAKQYYQSYNKNEFKFINTSEDEVLLDLVFNSFSLVNQSLFRLGGFLNTSKLYTLTNKQIKIFLNLYNKKLPFLSIKQCDKTNTFLNYIGLESQLLLNLINLARIDKNEDIINRIINDRLIAIKNYVWKCIF